MKERKTKYFTKLDRMMWGFSIIIILMTFIMFDREYYIMLIASLVGVTSLIFNAKGNSFGQFLMLVFSVLYGIISFQFSYYGEMITYLGMTAPMAFLSLITWIRNPFEHNKMQVEVNEIKRKEVVFLFGLTLLITIIFYFILKVLNTTNLELSTISVTTSFVAAYLTFRRSPYYAIGYAFNDIVLILLWILASFVNNKYISVVVCFILFFINDLYGFINWSKMKKEQKIVKLRKSIVKNLV